MTKIKTPILLFKENDKNIYAYNFALMADKSLVSFYKKTTTVDSEGNVYKVKSARQKGGVKLWQSLKSLSLMVEVEPEIEDTYKISLTELKTLIIDHITKNPKHWLVLDTMEGIKQKIDATTTFKDLIMIFR